MRQANVILFLCASVWSAHVAWAAPMLLDAHLDVSTYANGLIQPTSFAFIAEDDVLVTERTNGLVRRVRPGMATSTVLDLDVISSRERGLLGMAVHPSFATNGLVYLYYSATDAGTDSPSDALWTQNRVSRFTWDGSNLVSEKILLRFERDPAQGNGPNHNGGSLDFGPHGKLYGATGDLLRNRAEQNNLFLAGTSASVGGIFRVEAPGVDPLDGTPAADNPFVSHANPDLHPWFAYGVRNSFGLAFDPVTDALWDTENGPFSYDEINVVAPGFNSGWRTIMGPESRDPQSASDLVDLGPGSTYSDPEFSFLSPIGITDLEFLADFAFSLSYDDAIIFGGSNFTNAGRLHILRLNTARDAIDVSDLSAGLADLVTDSALELDELTFGTGFGVVTDIQVAQGGALYILSLDNGELYRIIPEPAVGWMILGMGIVLARRLTRLE